MSSTPRIVRGNQVTIALPLERLVITSTGQVAEEYVPDPDDEIVVNVRERQTFRYVPTISDNVATFVLGADVPCGVYGVEVLITKADGTRLRSYRLSQIAIVENNERAGLGDGVEFGVDSIQLDTAVYYAVDALEDVDYTLDTDTMELVLSPATGGDDEKPTPTPTPTPVAKPQTQWRRVRHCIPYGAKTGFVYTGKMMVEMIDGEQQLMPCMIFPNDKTIFDLSVIGCDCFVEDPGYGGHHDQCRAYRIDKDAQTIEFLHQYDEGINGDAQIGWLKFPDGEYYHSKVSNRRFGYYIDNKGKLQITHSWVTDGYIIPHYETILTTPILDPPLEPITNAEDIKRGVGLVHHSKSYKNIDRINQNRGRGAISQYMPNGKNVAIVNPRGIGFYMEINVWRYVHRVFNRQRDEYAWTRHRILKWCRVIPSNTLTIKGKGSRNLKNGDGWNCVGVGPIGRRSYLFIRVRRTNKSFNRFSDWTYWRVGVRGDDNHLWIDRVIKIEPTMARIFR